MREKTIAIMLISCLMLGFSSISYAREISNDDMKQIMQDTNCLVVELEEVKKSLEIEREETDKYIQLSNELNAKNKDLRKASNEKRWGGIALGLLIGVGVGALAAH